MFVVDTSDYLGKYNFLKVKAFMKAFVKYFRVSPRHVRIGAVTYSTNVRDNFNLNSYKSLKKVLRAIDSIEYVQGKEKTGQALKYVRMVSFRRQYGARLYVQSIAIVITNGKSTDPDSTLKQANLLKREGVKVFVVAIGEVSLNGIMEIASVPSDWFIIQVPNYSVLEKYVWILAYRIYWGK